LVGVVEKEMKNKNVKKFVKWRHDIQYNDIQ
jgi:hypothetical protein